MVEFCVKLRLLMDEAGIKPYNLSKSKVVSDAMVSRYLEGESEPTYSVIQKIAEFFDIPAGYFFSELDPKSYRHLADCAKTFEFMEDLKPEDQSRVLELMSGFSIYLSLEKKFKHKSRL